MNPLSLPSTLLSQPHIVGHSETSQPPAHAWWVNPQGHQGTSAQQLPFNWPPTLI